MTLSKVIKAQEEVPTSQSGFLQKHFIFFSIFSHLRGPVHEDPGHKDHVHEGHVHKAPPTEPGRRGPGTSTTPMRPHLRSRANAAPAPRSCATVVLRGARSSSPGNCPAVAGYTAPIPESVSHRPVSTVLRDRGPPRALVRGPARSRSSVARGPLPPVIVPRQWATPPHLRNWAAADTVPQSCATVVLRGPRRTRSRLRSPARPWSFAARGCPLPVVVPRRQAKVLAPTPSRLRLQPNLRSRAVTDTNPAPHTAPAPDNLPAMATAHPRSCVPVDRLSNFFVAQSPAHLRGLPPTAAVPRREAKFCVRDRGSPRWEVLLRPRSPRGGKIPRA